VQTSNNKFINDLLHGAELPEEVVDLEDGLASSYDYLEAALDASGHDDSINDVINELVCYHGAIHYPAHYLIVFPYGTIIHDELIQGISDGSITLVDPDGRTDVDSHLGAPVGIGQGQKTAVNMAQTQGSSGGSMVHKVNHALQGYVSTGAVSPHMPGIRINPAPVAGAAVNLTTHRTSIPGNFIPPGTVTVTDPNGNPAQLTYPEVIEILESLDGEDDDEFRYELMGEIDADPNGASFLQGIHSHFASPPPGSTTRAPADPLVEGLIKTGNLDTDGSVYLTQQMVEEFLVSKGRDPLSARGIMQTLIRQGADDHIGDGFQVIIPESIVAALAPSISNPTREKTFGKRLPDGTALMTRKEYQDYMVSQGRDVDDADIDLEALVDYGATLRGDEIIIPPDLIDEFAIPVPPIPTPQRQALNAANAVRPTTAAPTSIADLFGLSEDTEIERYSQVIRHDFFDKEMFQELVDQSPAMSDSVLAGQGTLTTWPELTFDLWSLIYKVQPNVRTKEQMQPDYLANLHLINYAAQTESFDELREFTSGSMMDSILGYEVIVIEVLQYIRKCREEYEQRKEEAQKAYEQAIKDWLEGGGDPADPNAPQSPVNAQGIMLPGSNGGGSTGGLPMPGALIDAANAMAQAQQAADAAQGVIDAAADMGDPNALPDDLKDALAEAQAAAAQAAADKQALEEQIQQVAEDLASQLERAMEQIGEKALDQTGPIRDWIAQYGLGNGDKEGRPSGVRTSFADSKRALERIRHNTDFQRFAKLLGRFRNIALADIKKKSKKNGVAIKDVKISNKVENALPGELALLADPVMQDEFYRKYAEGQLMTYEKENTDVKGKGPILVLMDMSGSMGSDKIDWAKALSLALLEVAQKEKRDFAFIAFDDRVRHCNVFQKDVFDPNDMLDIAQIASCGGTVFQPPLEMALEIITGQYKSPIVRAAVKKINLTGHRFKKADITFITDGDSQFDDVDWSKAGGNQYNMSQEDRVKYVKANSPFLKRFLEIKEEREFNVRSVLINIGGYGASDATVKMFSDSILTLNNVSDLSAANAAEIFAQVRGLGGADDLDCDVDEDDEDDA